MQGASTLAPVPGKARESRKTDACIPLSHFAWGFVFFSSSDGNSAIDDSSSIELDTIWVAGQVALDCIKSTIYK